MRTAAGIVGVTALLCFAGTGILVALRVARPTPRGVASALGLSYLAGTAATMVLGILLLLVGVPYRLPHFTLVALAVGFAGVAVAFARGGRLRVRRPMRPRLDLRARLRAAPLPSLVAGAAGVLVTSFLVTGFIASLVRPLDTWDGWSIWTRKALFLFDFGFDDRFFAGPAYGFAHLEYPILLPLFEATYMRGMGGIDTQALHAGLWLLLVAFVGAAAFLGARVGRAWLWIPVAAAAVLAGNISSQLLTGYADVVMGFFLGAGALGAGIWLTSRRTRYLALAALLLAAAASTKDEGILGAIAVFLGLAVVVVIERRRRALGTLALAAVGVAVGIVPWQLWLSAHDIHGDLPLGKGLTPSYLAGRADRIKPAAVALSGQLESGGLAYIPALALALVVVALFTRRARRVAAFYGIAGVGTFVAVLWAFVITHNSLSYQIGTSVTRVVMATQFVAVAALLHLGGLLSAPREALAGGQPDEDALATPRRSSIREVTDPIATRSITSS